MIRTEELRKNPQTQVLTDSAKVLMVIGPDRRIVVYPCSSWDWMNFVCIYPDTSDRRLQWSSEVEVQDMVEKFKGFHPSIVAALSMASNAGVWQLRQRVPLPTLVKDCYVLVGDAAHAMGPRTSALFPGINAFHRVLYEHPITFRRSRPRRLSSHRGRRSSSYSFEWCLE